MIIRKNSYHFKYLILLLQFYNSKKIECKLKTSILDDCFMLGHIAKNH